MGGRGLAPLSGDEDRADRLPKLLSLSAHSGMLAPTSARESNCKMT